MARKQRTASRRLIAIGASSDLHRTLPERLEVVLPRIRNTLRPGEIQAPSHLLSVRRTDESMLVLIPRQPVIQSELETVSHHGRESPETARAFRSGVSWKRKERKTLVCTVATMLAGIRGHEIHPMVGAKVVT
jgi:hypothetical protein